MQQYDTEDLRDEVLRLVELERDLIKKMLARKDVLTDKKQALDEESARQKLEVLDGEAVKLRELEVVVAVVGTMKAGKSTAINAIVGTEVLPHREEPMTALPTLIRHRSGFIEPCLTFINHKPVEELMERLREKVTADDWEMNCSSGFEFFREDLSSLVERIKRKVPLKAEYKGAKAIFGFLRDINDLVRLSGFLREIFPFESYKRIQDFAVIEVEFLCLRGKPNSLGRLVLLDTPGPNEAGQSDKLGAMLQDQLEKASAVLVVFDGTQLNSVADEAVREKIKSVADSVRGRIYGLVNKFDRGNEKEYMEKRRKAFALMGDRIPQDRIYPVSAEMAYLAGRARTELDKFGVLPDFAENPWVEKFGEMALRRDWEDGIHDPEQVGKGADWLWEKSRFQVLLDNVIQEAHSQASMLAIESAMARIVEIGARITVICNIRRSALRLEDADKLRQCIAALQQEIVKAEDSKINIQVRQQEQLEEFMCKLKNKFEDRRTEVERKFKHYMSAGARTEKFSKDSDSAASTKSSGDCLAEESVWEFLGGDFEINGTTVNFFDDKSGAEKLVAKAKDYVEGLLREFRADVESDVYALRSEFAVEFESKVMRQAKETLMLLSKRFSDDGFQDLEIKLPVSEKLNIQVPNTNVLESSVIEENRSSSVRRREEEGFWGGVKRGAGWVFRQDDWGYEEYRHAVVEHKVDLNRLEREVISNLERSFGKMTEDVSCRFRKPFENAVEDFFADFSNQFEEFKGSFLQSLKDQELSRQAQAELLDYFTRLGKTVKAALQDVAALYREMEKATKLKNAPVQQTAVVG